MIKVKELDSEYNLTLHKMNNEILSDIDVKYLREIKKSITDVDTISLSIPKFTYDSNFKKVINSLYLDVKHERYIHLNKKETYIIRNIKKTDSTKEITAESREVILKKMDLKFEDIGFRLMSSDEDNYIYNLNDYMFEETGWKFGYIDDKVRYQSDGVTEKMRWQESVDGYWYEYLIKTVAEQFSCIVIFDSYNKLVNLYDIDSFGNGLQLCLSNDNYMKSLEKQTSSSDITTKLKLEGNEGLSIVEYNPCGVDYIENYSYFIENKEMSQELIDDLELYYRMVEKRTVVWEELLSFKNEKDRLLLDKKMLMLQLISDIKGKTSIMKSYEVIGDADNMAKISTEITELRDKEKLLDDEINNLEDEIELLKSSINEIVILCKKPTATDDNGELIFTEETLKELKNYTYTDTFSDDSYVDIESLMSVGEKKLELNCRPTSTWDIGVTDFTSRIIDNGLRQHFKGVLSLGDVIALYDDIDDTEELVYLVGYIKSLKDNSLSFELSNKKVDRSDLIQVTDILTDAKKAVRLLNSKRYLLIQQEKNRINLGYKKGGDALNVER